MEVTANQLDRKAALAAYESDGIYQDETRLLSGEEDTDTLIQAFARHRLDQIERDAVLIEQHQEFTIGHERSLGKRSEGDKLGLAFAAAIRSQANG